MKNKKIYTSTRDFDKDYKNIKEILQDENIEEAIKEEAYNDFLNTYPLFDSRKLDKYSKYQEVKMKKELNKNISDPQYNEDKKDFKLDISLSIRGYIAPYIAKGYSLESLAEAVKEVAEEVTDDGPLKEFDKIVGGK